LSLKSALNKAEQELKKAKIPEKTLSKNQSLDFFQNIP